jgi:hypothetical protein
MLFAGATTPVLPIGADGLTVLSEEQLAIDMFGYSLVLSIPGSGCIAFEDFVGEATQTYGASGEGAPTCTCLKTRLVIWLKRISGGVGPAKLNVCGMMKGNACEGSFFKKVD